MKQLLAALLFLSLQSYAYTVDVPLQDQTITFNTLPTRTVSATPFSISATSSSNLSVSFSTTSTTCSLSGETVTVLSAGTCSITASQTGDGTFNPAEDVTQSFEVIALPALVFVDPSYSGSYAEATLDGHTFGIDAFTTIQDALPNTASGGTVYLNGTFTENVVITQPVKITSEGASVEGLIEINSNNVSIEGTYLQNPSGLIGIKINHVDGVTIKNNTIQNIGTGAVTGSVYGIYFADEDTTSNSNIAITDNTITNIGKTTGTGVSAAIAFGDATGTGSISAVSIIGNTITNVRANTIDDATGKTAYGILVLHADGIEGNTGSTALTIQGNTISNLTGQRVRGIALEGNTPNTSILRNTLGSFTGTASTTPSTALYFANNPSLSTVSINSNSIDTESVGLAGINTTTETARVTRNFWNTTLTSDKFVGNFAFSPWWPDAEMLFPQFLTQVSGSNTVTTLSEDFEAGVKTKLGAVTVTIDIPDTESFTITGPVAWDGTISGPIQGITITPTIEGAETEGLLSIDVGIPDGSLTFSHPVRLLFEDMAGKKVGFSSGSTFHPINPTCTADTREGIDSNQECSIDVGADLAVWTKHFTTFTVFNQTITSSPTPSPTPSNGPVVQSSGDGINLNTSNNSAHTTQTSTTAQQLGAQNTSTQGSQQTVHLE